MSAAPPSQSKLPKPLILTPKDEIILQQFATFRFLTSKEITALCYSKGSQTYARARLSALSGNQDITNKDVAYGYPLWRCGFPTGKRGNNERVFSLSLTGRQMLERLGIPVSWHMRPEQLRTFSHSYLLHDLSRNRFIVALLTWAKSRPNLRIETRLSYEIAKQPPTIEIPVRRSVLEKGQMVSLPVMTKIPVIPDGEILVTNTRKNQRLLILLGIDHNTQARERLRTHITALLSYTKSFHFKRRYGDITSRIVYATQGVTDDASKSRLAYLCDFTRHLLIERKQQEDSQNFRFTTITFAKLYEDANRLFGSEEPSWYLPGELKQQSPVALFPDANPQIP